MKSHPIGYLFTDAEDCCQAHFRWDLRACRKNTFGPPKWYPNFDTEEGKCLNDGLEPLYMKRYYDDYMSNTQEECCKNYYPWNVRGCITPDPVKLTLLQDPCANAEDETWWYEIYDESYLTNSEFGFYPVCK